MPTIDNQLAFLSSGALLESYNAKTRKQIRRVCETLRSFLPSDKNSLWPKELRKKTVSGWLTHIVVAFSGTMGVSATFGYKMGPFIKDIKSWTGGLDQTRRSVFNAIVNNRFLEGNEKERYFEADDLARRLKGSTAWPVINYDGMDYPVSGEDLHRLVNEMRTYRSRAYLTKISQIDEWNGAFYVLTFNITAGLSFHLLSAPTLYPNG